MKLLSGIYFLLFVAITSGNAASYQTLLEEAKSRNIITQDMVAYRRANQTELRLVAQKEINLNEVDFSSLYHIRIACDDSLLAQLGKSARIFTLVNAEKEYLVLKGTIDGTLPAGIQNVPLHILQYVDRLKAQYDDAQLQLKRLSVVLNQPANQLEHSPQFSPARSRSLLGKLSSTATEQQQLFFSPTRDNTSQRESGIVWSPKPSLLWVEHSTTVAQDTPLDKRLLRQRREQHALISPLRKQLTEAEKRAMEAEQARDAVFSAMESNVAALNATHAESQMVLGLQAECFHCQAQIALLMCIIERDTALMNGNFSRLRDLRCELEVLKGNLQTTLELLQIIVGELPSGNF